MITLGTIYLCLLVLGVMLLGFNLGFVYCDYLNREDKRKRP